MEAGLTEHQADVYLELIKNPEETAGSLAKQLSLDRSFTYGILNSLIDKGMVSYITKENRRYFSPSDPENLLKEVDEKRAKLVNIVGELKKIKSQQKKENSVSVYEGKVGLKVYVRDLLDSGEFFTLGGGGKFNILEKLKYEYPHYLEELKKKKMKGKTITSLGNLPLMKELFKNSEVKLKTLEGLKSHVNFVIYQDKLTIYSAEEKPYVIVIENEDIAVALKGYFDNLWKLAK